jgi:hypothetical protein
MLKEWDDGEGNVGFFRRKKKKSNDDLSLVFVTANSAPALEDIMRAVIKSQQDEEDEEEMGEEIHVNDIWNSGIKVTQKAKIKLTFKERLLSKQGGKKSDYIELPAVSPASATTAPALGRVSKSSQRGTWELDHDTIELNSDGVVQGEILTMRNLNLANQERSSTKKVMNHSLSAP